MLEAAVPSKSFDPTAFNESSSGNHLVHEDWLGYNNTWCSFWFKLFPADDLSIRG